MEGAGQGRTGREPAPRAVVCGLVPQFLLLPSATWLATLLLDLPPSTEAAMILVAACPGGSLSNVVTHFGRGNTALSVSISAVASVMALFLTPLNFTWMVSTNPATLPSRPVSCLPDASVLTCPTLRLHLYIPNSCHCNLTSVPCPV